MKNTRLIILFFVAVSACLFTLTGCNKELDDRAESEQVVVKLSVDELFQEKAEVRVRHNGDSDQFWYSFVTEDLTSDAEELFAAELIEALEIYGRIEGSVGVNKRVVFNNLTPRKTYRAVAAAITSTGDICSNVAEIEFVTKRRSDDFFVNENWSIEYTRREVSEVDQNIESELFTITSKDSLTFCPFVILKNDFEQAYNSSVQECFESYVEFRNSENVRWSRAIMVADTTYTEDRLRSNDYIAFMMGIDADGVLTGNYARKDFTLEQETQTSEYKNWLGKWLISGETYDNTKKMYEVTIEADENNLYYKMYGWEGDITEGYYTNVPTDFPITLYFEKTSGKAYVVSGYIGEPADDVLFYVYGNAVINESITPINIENLKVASFSYIDGKPYLSPEKYSVYDAAGNQLTGQYSSFSYCYTLRGFEYVGFAPFTADSRVPDLLGVKLEKLN